MKFTNKITGFFVMGIWFLIVGYAGIGFQMIQPESFRGEAAATIFIPCGCALLLYVLYRMHQYRLNLRCLRLIKNRSPMSGWSVSRKRVRWSR